MKKNIESNKTKTQRLLYNFILNEYKASGKFIYTNRQLGVIFSRTAKAMQYNVKILQEKGYINSETVVEDSGYVVRYITPVSMDREAEM